MRQMRRQRHGGPARGLAAALAAAALAACSGEEAAGPPQATPVSVVAPTVREITPFQEYVGRFAAVERVEVRPRVSGYLEKVHFQDGAVVEAGAPLFTIDTRPFQAALDAAEARAEASRTAKGLAEAELARARKLLEARAGSQEEFDQRAQAAAAAGADLNAALAEVESARLNLEFCEIAAPAAGRLSRKLVDRGNLVAAEQTLLTTLVSIDPIYFEFTANEADYLRYVRANEGGQRLTGKVSPNPVAIRLEDADSFDVEGRIDFVDNEINRNTGAILVRAAVDNPDGLLAPGMFGRVRVFAPAPVETVLIPDAAVQIDQSRQFVWVMNDESAAEARPVRLGRVVEDDMRVVEAGLEPADRVIIGGFMRLRPGAPVVVKPDGPPPAGASVPAGR